MSPPIEDQPTPPDLREQAMAWLVRLGSGDVTSEDRATFRRWQAASPQHRCEFEKLAAMWGTFEHVEDPRIASRRDVLAGSAFACAAAIGVGTAYRTHLWARLTGGFVTEPGEMRSLILADGTALEMDADTAVSVDVSATARVVEVHRGRVMLTVTPDRRGPFVAAARNGLIFSDKSQFVLHLAEDETILSVLDESVRLSLTRDRSSQDGASVKSDQCVAFDTEGIRPSPQATAAESAWRQHRLVFENQPLHAVISELNRYRSGRIVLLGEALGHLRLSGIFDTRDPDRVLASIESTLPVRVTRLPYLVVMRAV